MFLEKKVVIYKPNPVNQAVTLPIYEFIFSSLIKDGFLSLFEVSSFFFFLQMSFCF